MYLDGEEERMLRAIVQSAVVAAAAGRPFAGQFHSFTVSATCMHVSENGIAIVGATIHQGGIAFYTGALAGFALLESEMPTQADGESASAKNSANRTIASVSLSQYVRSAFSITLRRSAGVAGSIISKYTGSTTSPLCTSSRSA
ncbi:MAG: hypothetical protein IPG28_17825 [Betaproteobacteria bacterium]|nr:hypothetical protein [Betaproteobacteria bacterium]